MNFFIAGVGGQGVILASDILAEVGLIAGYDVKKSDVLGMSQRGGSVVSQVRLGQVVHSPLIPRGEVDCLVALEGLEVARWTDYLRCDALVIANQARVPPPQISLGQAEYPGDERIMGILRQRTQRIYTLDATGMAEELGNARAGNVLLLGYLSHFLPLEEALWQESIARRVPARYLELNQRAFAQGRLKAAATERRER
jgi:indolepyruvate ferredoxin oxidoreductase beta subunit